MATGIPADRTAKRQKAEGGPMGGPPEGYRGYPAGRYHQPPRYAPGPGGPSMGPGGYMPWQHAQYGGPPPSHGWPHGTPPPGSMYMQQGGPPAMTPDRQGYGPSAYPRGGPPMRGPPSVQRPSKAGPPPGPGTRPPSQTPDGGSSDAPPHPTYKGGWGPGGQWPPSQWGSGPPPPGWQGAGPPMHHPPGYGGPPPPSMYGTSPPRSAQQRPPRGTPDMTGTYGGPPSSVICQPIDNSEMEMYHSRGVGPGMDDESSVSVAGGNSSSKDKGRGSYKCGRCGVPKKGHICPYQPKLTRRPGEPLPEMRSAAIQVEMDEFMTLRRLNLRIQGFAESYAVEPYMDEDMVVGEPAHPPHSISSAPPPMMTGGPGMSPPPDMMDSPMRSSPIAEDTITGAA